MREESQSAETYLKNLPKQIDGMTLIVCSVLSIIGAAALSADLIPWMHEKISKRVVIFLFTPLILFVVLVKFQLMPFSDGKYAAVFRSFVICCAFLVLNF